MFLHVTTILSHQRSREVPSRFLSRFSAFVRTAVDTSLFCMTPLLILWCLWLPWTLANKASFDSKYVPQVCAGMYSRHDWGGRYAPHIGLQLNEYDGKKYSGKKAKGDLTEDTLVAPVLYVIFEIKDLEHIGYRHKDGTMKYICDTYAINTLKACKESQRGKFIVNNDTPTNNTILTLQLLHLGPAHINYTVSKTGYYCVSTYILLDKGYHGLVNFQNAFGLLAASEIPKLPAYGILTILYGTALALYGFQFYMKRHRNQILPLQRYLLAMLGFLTFDTLVVWLYYDLVNRNLNPSLLFVTVYMVCLAILNSAKMTFAFFLLLCIALGYGVVVLKLKKKVMLRCKLLAAAHFAASCLYFVLLYWTGLLSQSLQLFDDEATRLLSASLWLVVPIIPIAFTLTAYYLAILILIRKTTATLHAQRQVIKLRLYENLFRIIFGLVAFTFLGLMLSLFIFVGMSSTSVIETYWKGAYFVFDFWPSVVFFVVFMGIGWLWRPTETSYMLAILQQLLQQADDEEGAAGGAGAAGYQQGTEFELDDLSLMSHSDGETPQVDDEDSFELRRSTETAPPKYEDTDKQNLTSGKGPSASKAVDAGKPSTKDGLPTAEGSTLFELGEDSDGEGGDDRLK